MGHRTTTRYFDSILKAETFADLTFSGDGKLRRLSSADQLGRPIKSETSEDGFTYTISSESVYHQMGRIVFQSNPHRAASSSTHGWTRTTKDTLGRIIDVTSFSGPAIPPDSGGAGSTGSVITGYNGNTTTVTDQAGKSRSSEVDGLGRLVKVTEAPNGQAFITAYGYDSLGNLTLVVQGVQQRIFTYDAMSRLRSAKNPEQVNTSGLMVATIYDYDDSSNLITRINPNGGTVSFSYDGMNRVKTKTLSVGGSFNYAYDTAVNGRGRLAAVTSFGGDGYYYDGYDASGRVTAGRQQTTVSSSQYSYPMSYVYNLAGNMTSETYPSGKVIASDYDDAGRLTGVRKGSTASYYAGALPTSGDRITYTAHGATSALKLGNGKWNTRCSTRDCNRRRSDWERARMIRVC